MTTPSPTPDPLLSSEGIAGIVVAMVANVYVLWGAHLDDARKNALAAIITSVWVVAQFAHAAYVRGSRAKGGVTVGVHPAARPAARVVASYDPATGAPIYAPAVSS